MKSPRQYWGTWTPPGDRVLLCRIGPLRLWLARSTREWGIAHEHGTEPALLDHAAVPADVVPAGLDWQFIAYAAAPASCLLRPRAPDRPVVVRTARPLGLPPGERITLYAHLPLWVEVCSGDAQAALLASVPAQPLSDTWFGGNTQGQLCYALPQAAEIEYTAAVAHPHHIVCPIETSNAAHETLRFDKLCLRPRHLALFAGARHLWASPVRIRLEGKAGTAAVRYAHTAPVEEADLRQLAEPPEPAEKVLHRLVFHTPFNHDFMGATK
jgi:hypothetical protein